MKYMDTTLADVRDNLELSNALLTAKDIVTTEYLYHLENYEVYELPDELKEVDISAFVRLYRFKKLVTDKEENTIDKLVTVLNAAYSSRATVVTIIRGTPDEVEYYLGVVSCCPAN